MRNRIIGFFCLMAIALQAVASEDKTHADWLALVRATFETSCSVSEPRVGDRLIGYNGFRMEQWFVDTCRGTAEYGVSYYPAMAFPDRATPYEVALRTPPKRALGFVANAEVAIKIAVAAWEPVFGKEKMGTQRPYIATLQGDIWTVRGSLPPHVKGGVAVADISRTDGALLRISHGK